MYNHAPDGYDCPFCRLACGDDTPLSSQDDLVYRDRQVIALVSIDWWPNNPGDVLVVPVEHFENVYDLPPSLGTPLQSVIRNVALAMKDAYGCTGVTVRQNNEPDGSQDVWHHHTKSFHATRGRPAKVSDSFRTRLRNASPTSNCCEPASAGTAPRTSVSVRAGQSNREREPHDDRRSSELPAHHQ
jgi:histidine triad (HIT) family protein